MAVISCQCHSRHHTRLCPSRLPPHQTRSAPCPQSAGDLFGCPAEPEMINAHIESRHATVRANLTTNRPGQNCFPALGVTVHAGQAFKRHMHDSDAGTNAKPSMMCPVQHMACWSGSGQIALCVSAAFLLTTWTQGLLGRTLFTSSVLPYMRFHLSKPVPLK